MGLKDIIKNALKSMFGFGLLLWPVPLAGADAGVDTRADGYKKDILIDYSVKIGNIKDDLSTWTKNLIGKLPLVPDIPENGNCCFYVYGSKNNICNVYERRECKYDSIRFNLNAGKKEVSLFSQPGLFIQSWLDNGKTKADTIEIPANSIDPAYGMWLLSKSYWTLNENEKIEVEFYADTSKTANKVKIKRKPLNKGSKELLSKINERGKEITSLYEIKPAQGRKIIKKQNIASMVLYCDEKLPLALELVFDDGSYIPFNMHYLVWYGRIRTDEKFEPESESNIKSDSLNYKPDSLNYKP